MLNEEVKNRWNQLFQNDKLEELLQEIISHPETGMPIEECLILSSRLEGHNRTKRQGTIQNEEYNLHRNLIRVAVLELVNSNPTKERDNISPKHYLSWTFKLFYGIFCILLFGFMIYYIDMCFSNLPKLPPTNYNQEPELVSAFPYPAVSTKNISTFKFFGIDGEGKRADYIIYLVRGFNWRIGQVAVSEDNGIPIDICHYLTGNGISQRINSDSLQAIICFGNTSFEEDTSLTPRLRMRKEETRASERAEELAKCVSDILVKLTPVYTLNLGKYTEEDEDSRYQREILIIGLVGKEKGVVEEEALFSGLLQEHYKGNLSIDIQLFSRVRESSLPLRKLFN